MVRLPIKVLMADRRLSRRVLDHRLPTTSPLTNPGKYFLPRVLRVSSAVRKLMHMATHPGSEDAARLPSCAGVIASVYSPEASPARLWIWTSETVQSTLKEAIISA